MTNQQPPQLPTLPPPTANKLSTQLLSNALPTVLEDETTQTLHHPSIGSASSSIIPMSETHHALTPTVQSMIDAIKTGYISQLNEEHSPSLHSPKISMASFSLPLPTITESLPPPQIYTSQTATPPPIQPAEYYRHVE